MSEGIQPEIVLNEFGELTRKTRRELLARGIDPDTAVIEHIRTQSIPIITQAVYATHADTVAASVIEPSVQHETSHTENSALVFAPSLSRRDMRNLRERTASTQEIPFMLVDAIDSKSAADADSVAETESVAEATEATASIVIDYREDLSDVTNDYEPFSISTTSTQSTGIIPTTGSALILPMLPEHAPGARSSFNHTGEILITGSIMLPSGIGQYGADFLSLDTSEIDIIADDDDVSSSQDLAPVSASSAVSAYNTSSTVVTVPSKFRDRLPLILAITAAGLAVGVVALFITGYVLGVF